MGMMGGRGRMGIGMDPATAYRMQQQQQVMMQQQQVYKPCLEANPHHQQLHEVSRLVTVKKQDFQHAIS